jgi:hypothetical protein
MAHSVVLCPRSSPKIAPSTLPTTAPSALPRHTVHISEQRVFTDLGPGEHDHDKWVLDSGAMNHMTSYKELFVEIDTHIYNTVKFGDGSVTAIEGRGTIILTCKTREHRALMSVYYIPRLKASIVSIG